MDWRTVVTFLGAAMLVTLSPGPDILTVVARSLAQGTWAGIVATMGFATGLIFHTTVVACGVAVMLKAYPEAKQVIQFGGAAYLLYLAVRMFVGKDEVLGVKPEAETRTLRRIYGQSIVMNVLNPKVTLFFLSFVTPFAKGWWPVWIQVVVLGALFAVCTIVGFGACAVAAGWLSRFFARKPGSGRVFRIGTGVLFLVIAGGFVLAAAGII